MSRRFLPALVGIFLLLFGQAVGAAAQGAGRASLLPPDTSAFPQISAYLSVNDAQGKFVTGLQLGEVQVLEDGNALPLSALELLHPGVQLVVAINQGPAFAIRNTQGQTRYERLVLALQDWSAGRSGSTLDDLSMLANGGPAARHLSDAGALLQAIRAYQPDGRSATPSYDLLGSALEMAADPTQRPGMGRAVLFITGLPKEDTSIGLQSLAARANQRGIRVFVWLVASADQFDIPAAKQLAEFAVKTEGAFSAYSGVEPLPDLETYLEPLRNIYRLEYRSQLKASGLHRLAVQVKNAVVEAETGAQEFDLEISAPNVAFISPQLEIVRSPVPVNPAGPRRLAPTEQVLEILVEFPDGHERSLARSVLYVDGKVAVEKNAPPFDAFAWDLTPYTQTGGHVIRVEVTDILGLSSASMEVPIVIRVREPEQNVLLTVSQNRGLLAGLAVALAGSVLALVLILGGRLRPGSWPRLRRRAARPMAPPPPEAEAAEPAPQRLPNWINRLHWPQRRLALQATAFLVCLADPDQETTAPPISLYGEEITFGSDPTQAIQVIEDPSVAPLHARLRRKEDGIFWIGDEGSIAGTWVNYDQVPAAGVLLEHGDLVHFGRAGFRFNLRTPARLRKPVVLPEEPAL